MNKDEMKEKFEKHVEYLQRNIAPDDIYVFTEQTFMACLFFIHKWNEWVDLQEECSKDPIVNKWITNILGFQMCRDQDLDINVDLDLKSVEPSNE